MTEFDQLVDKALNATYQKVRPGAVVPAGKTIILFQGYGDQCVEREWTTLAEDFRVPETVNEHWYGVEVSD